MDDGIKTFRIRRGHELEDVFKLFNMRICDFDW